MPDIFLRSGEANPGDVRLRDTTAADSAGSITGTGSLAFAFSESATGTETFTGTGAVAFGFSESGTGSETVTGTGGVAFGFTEGGTGAETFSGTGAVAFGFTLAGTGTAAGGAITGTGGLAFSFTEAATGANASIQPGHGGGRLGGRPRYIAPIRRPTVTTLPEPIAAQAIEGYGGLRFTFDIAVTGETNDDDLALTLLLAA